MRINGTIGSSKASRRCFGVIRMKIEENEIYTTKEVAEILKISMPTIKRMLKDGRLKSTRIGRQHRFLGKEILNIMRGRGDAGAATVRKEPEPAAIEPPDAVRETAITEYDASPQRPKETPDERRRSYMLGKRLRSDILADDGSVIFAKGSIVTEETIGEAGRRSRLLDLFSNLE